MALSLAAVWKALGGGHWPWDDLPLASVVVDSRLVTPGSLFVALPGEHTDGHEFVADAFRRGAYAALVQRPLLDCDCYQLPVAGFQLDNSQAPRERGEGLVTADRLLSEALPICFLVPNTLDALHQLAAYWRSLHLNCRVVGVTGSVGKTTTKELIAAVLRQRFTTLKSPGNYNNEIGLPLTMLQLHPAVEWIVQEMGMYALGEIAHLASIARPEIGVVTNVGPTHLERLGSIERIAQAKSELVQALPGDGLAVLNGDDDRVRRMAALSKAKNVLYYGLQSHNDLWASDVQTYGLQGLRMTFHFRGQSVSAQLPLLGQHSVYGALAAATVALGGATGMTWDEVIAGLRDSSAEMRVKVLPGVRGATILDDTYNANPASTVAALDLLSEMNGRKVAVLGGMLELGSYEEEGHRVVGRRAAEVAALLVTVGRLGRLIASEAVASGMPAQAVLAVADNDAAVALLLPMLQKGDFVLVKGSRGFAMESVVARLIDMDKTAEAGGV